jgi:hypothetical protein
MGGRATGTQPVARQKKCQQQHQPERNPCNQWGPKRFDSATTVGDLNIHGKYLS